MELEAQFLFDNRLIAELEDLIRNSKKELLLISPYIDLSNRIKDALSEKKDEPNFKLKILFGKNEGKMFKSVKKDSFLFFKNFPNIEIRYEERLHAKFYLNESHFLLTSLNLYDYSLANNIECGMLVHYASRSVMGKVMDGASELLDSGISKVKNDFFGIGKDEVDPIDKFNSIFNAAETFYQTEPIYKEDKGLSGLISRKKIKSFNILIDKLPKEKNSTGVRNKINTRVYSSSKLSNKLKIDQKLLLEIFEREGLILDDKILEEGRNSGLIYKSYMGKKYIAYPEDLKILKDI